MKNNKKIVSILTAFIAIFTLFATTKVNAARTTVTEVNARTAVYDVFIRDEDVRPLVFEFGSDIGFNFDNSWWERKNESNEWEKVETGKFTPGAYRYRGQLALDEDAGIAYVLDESVEVYINGTQWTTDTPVITEGYSYVYVTSPEITMSDETYTINLDPNGGTPGPNFVTSVTLGQNQSLELSSPDEDFVKAPTGKIFVGFRVTYGGGDSGYTTSYINIQNEEYYDGATIKYLWGDPITEINLKFISPTEGTSTNTTKGTFEEYEYWQWDKQTNTPKFYSNESDLYEVIETMWVDKNSYAEYAEDGSFSYYDPYIGKLNTGSSYTVQFYLNVMDLNRAFVKAEELTVKVNGKVINPKIFADASYAIIAYDVKIDNAVKPPFSDTKTSAWYFDSVMAAYEKGIIKGYDNGKFGVNDRITRGQLAVILYRLEESPNVSSLTNPFDDVAAGKYYTDAVKWAYANHIVNGYANGNFGPNDNIKRKDFAVMLHNYAKAKSYSVDGYEELVGFADYDKIQGNYAEPALKWAYGYRIISGSEKDGKRYLNPNNNATRAEAAAMIVNFIDSYSYDEYY